MIKKTILINLILFSSLIAFGQINDSTKSKEWIVELGYQNSRLFDKNVSPLIYVSNNGVLSFQFQKTNTQNLWNVGLNASVGNMQSKRFGRREATVYDPYTINGNRDSVIYDINPGLSFIQASLYYSYYWKLNTHKNKMYIGAIVQDNFYYGALGADVWFFNQLSIMPAYRIELFNTSKSNIDAEFSTPVFSYLLRQPYTLDPSLPENSYFKANLKTGSSLSTINKFQQLNIKLKYRYTLKKGKQIGLSYYFMWMNYANISDRNLRAYSNSILISYTF